ncbi:LAME_0F05248g1_1 [Lachancea meyersii CBS 8951]|uniref:LAME_0F05248g1_1 n=1 Tax=Lachancea meyersii CBS 8951 TaxID=1266667 RepID=A0A1G4JSU3_9SACH|nr:LAME_0F05248g1_1 [Lachancea meyersii CBS 8951]
MDIDEPSESFRCSLSSDTVGSAASEQFGQSFIVINSSHELEEACPTGSVFEPEVSEIWKRSQGPSRSNSNPESVGNISDHSKSFFADHTYKPDRDLPVEESSKNQPDCEQTLAHAGENTSKTPPDETSSFAASNDEDETIPRPGVERSIQNHGRASPGHIQVEMDSPGFNLEFPRSTSVSRQQTEEIAASPISGNPRTSNTRNNTEQIDNDPPTAVDDVEPSDSEQNHRLYDKQMLFSRDKLLLDALPRSRSAQLLKGCGSRESTESNLHSRSVHKSLRRLINKANHEYFQLDSNKVRYRAGLSKINTGLPHLHERFNRDQR